MSEADRLTPEPAVPTDCSAFSPVSYFSTESLSQPESQPEQDTIEDGWQTVDFPGAMRIDDLPRDRELAVSHDSPNASSDTSLDSIALALVEQLRQENAQLRSQIACLEQDLSQGQIELQLAQTQIMQTQTSQAHATQSNQNSAAADLALMQQQVQELVATKDNLNRLFQELELSHQTAQRQQILVETLTEQLESSQERIAQLERDCTLLQQRYNEQVQQQLQVETTCRDLRMRLHRQQQQTLQFKAALEKSLEVPTPSSPAVALEEPTDVVGYAPSLTPKASPVQPWSSSTVDGTGGAVLPISQPNRSQPSPNTPLVPPPDLGKLLHTMFPTIAEEPSIVAASETVEPATVQQAAEIFDLSPFMTIARPATPPTTAATPEATQELSLSESIAADDELAAAIAALELQPYSDTSTPDDISSNAEPPRSNDPATTETGSADLWTDLEKVIALGNDSESPQVNSAETSSIAIDQIELNQTELNETESAHDPSISFPLATASAPVAARPPLKVFGLPDSTPIVQALMNSGVSSVNSSVQSSLAESAASQPESSLFSPNWPAPVLYPARPAKKLNSLAAVDLPTFPRPK